MTRANCEKLIYEKKPEGMRFMKSLEKNLAVRGNSKGKGRHCPGWPEWQEQGGSGRARTTRSRDKVLRVGGNCVHFATCWQVLSRRVT